MRGLQRPTIDLQRGILEQHRRSAGGSGGLALTAKEFGAKCSGCQLGMVPGDGPLGPSSLAVAAERVKKERRGLTPGPTG